MSVNFNHNLQMGLNQQTATAGCEIRVETRPGVWKNAYFVAHEKRDVAGAVIRFPLTSKEVWIPYTMEWWVRPHRFDVPSGETVVFGDTAAKARLQTGRDIITAIDAGAEYSIRQSGSYINVLSGSNRDGEGYPDRTYNGKATVRCGELSYTLNTTAPDIADADILAVLRYQVGA